MTNKRLPVFIYVGFLNVESKFKEVKEEKMIIAGKRKRKLDKKFLSLVEGTKIILGLAINGEIKNVLLEIGFTEFLSEGETVLPASNFGPICRFNSEGKFVIHKDQPMETAYRQIEWTWEQWAGYHNTETQTKIVDVPYKRYPRTLVPPPSIELSIIQNKDGNKYVVASEQELNFKNPDSLIHTINIFLEIFGYCEILSENLEGYAIKNLRRLNWEVLPPGKWPWKKIEKEVSPIVQKTTQQNQIVIKYRLKIITSYIPGFVAIGHAGFYGYLIFGFPKKNLYALESIYTGNATYIFEEEWEDLSKLTKAEILQGKLQKDRIIHREKWERHINNLLK